MSDLEVAVMEDGKVLEKQMLPIDSYVIVCGQRCEIAHKAVHANGTHVLTIKPIRGAFDD